MKSPRPKRVENYTNAALISLGVNLFWVLIALWATIGFWAVVLTGLVLNHLMTRVLARRQP
ncbi:MAG: hypothetical protein MK160_14105 [Rhodobacteraceae bacterium]|nr:hypothetical protein [Paracoccaceae bacterium]